ncbi:hypothetical protein CC80DRAFT_550424 [Byssothecium circinans]|uniref:Uncharacterized protein n=1 Tax=Byssothecium circinans TaxID=147558 RepID=A0A6A5TND9_9PLEO|nr:hypothetical protein CC80DRAFT_550424 [Byssothecium circinans]
MPAMSTISSRNFTAPAHPPSPTPSFISDPPVTKSAPPVNIRLVATLSIFLGGIMVAFCIYAFYCWYNDKKLWNRAIHQPTQQPTPSDRDIELGTLLQPCIEGDNLRVSSQASRSATVDSLDLHYEVGGVSMNRSFSSGSFESVNLEGGEAGKT